MYFYSVCYCEYNVFIFLEALFTIASFVRSTALSKHLDGCGDGNIRLATDKGRAFGTSSQCQLDDIDVFT